MNTSIEEEILEAVREDVREGRLAIADDSPETKRRQSAEISDQTDRFLLGGGQIQQIPQGATSGFQQSLVNQAGAQDKWYHDNTGHHSHV